jgi:hypothetical protein
MTTAVLLVPTPSAALLPFADGVTVVGRLVDQLRARGVTNLIALVRPDVAARLRLAGLGSAGLGSAGLGSAGVTVRESADGAADLAALAELARAAAEPLVLANGDLVAADGAVAVGLAGAGPGAAALIQPGSRTEGPGTPVRRERGRVVAAGSAYHRVHEPDGVCAGLVWVGRGRLGAAASAWSAAAGRPAAVTGDGEALDLALVALVRAGVPVAAASPGGLPAGRVRVAEDVTRARASLRTVDEERARLASAVKAEDDLFATYAVSSYSPRLVKIAARLGLTPTAVTWISVLFAAAAAVLFADGGRIAAVAGAVALYLGFVLDCVDGQLARYLRRYSRYGGWLDGLADRGKEYAVYAGLAVGAARTGTDVWPLALAALTLQTVRHMTDGWYGAVRDDVSARAAVRDFDAPADASPGPAGRLVRATNAGTGRRPWLYWAKRTIVFPIGERWLLIALCAALFDPRVVFLALLAGGTLAAAYALAVRLVRSRALQTTGMAIDGIDGPGVTRHRDDGPLARALYPLGRRPVIGPLAAGLVALVVALDALLVARTSASASLRADPGWAPVVLGAAALVLAASAGVRSHATRYDWFVPAVLRAVEFVLVMALVVGAGAPLWLAFALIAVVALFHYDLTARLDHRASPVAPRAAALGWDGRLAVLLVAALAGVLPAALGGLATYLAVLFVAGGLASLRRDAKAGPAGVSTRPSATASTGDPSATRECLEDASTVNPGTGGG